MLVVLVALAVLVVLVVHVVLVVPILHVALVVPILHVALGTLVVQVVPAALVALRHPDRAVSCQRLVLTRPLIGRFSLIFSEMLGLSWETSTQEDLDLEASDRPESRL